MKESGSDGSLREADLGVCPSGEHSLKNRQCGFQGCIDLRAWAKTHRYRFRLEESYRAENNTHVRGDGRWYVEILCKNGLIYPYGGTTLLVYAKARVAGRIVNLGPDIKSHQTDGKVLVFKFPPERLDEMAAILKPKKLPGRAELTPQQLETLREHAFRGGQTAQIRT